MYASLGRILNLYNSNDGFYNEKPFQGLTYYNETTALELKEAAQPKIKASSIYETFKALLEVKRPAEESGWESFASARKIVWKTGTSFGFRDAWAIGLTSGYVVAVWAGNADGEGRPGLTGAGAAAPAMFEIFKTLPVSEWFEMPIDEMQTTILCRQSGYTPSVHCADLDTVLLPGTTKLRACPYHQTVHLDQTKKYRVTSLCEKQSDMIHQSWFVLPPLMAYYYQQNHPFYKPLPPFKKGCEEGNEKMALVYPRQMENVFLPKQLDGSEAKILFELAHPDKNAVVYWYIDEQYLGSTSDSHKIATKLNPGKHRLYVVDGKGNQLARGFNVMEK